MSKDYLTEMNIPDDEPIKNLSHDEGGHYEPEMTAREMRERILELEEERNKLTKRAETLEECLLEISEIIYSGD